MTMADIEFIDGLIFKAPNEKAPEYVKAKLSINIQKLIAWAKQQNSEWVNADVKVSQKGSWYAAVDNWKPEPKGQDRPARSTTAPVHRAPVDDNDPSDSIPF